MKKFLFILILPVLIFAREALVEEVKIEKGIINPFQSFGGTLYFNKVSNIASESEGKVEIVKFDSGDIVKKGDMLIRVDSKILNAQINSAKAKEDERLADLRKSKKDLERFKKLYKKKSITEQEYDRNFYLVEKLRAQFHEAKANVAQLEAQKEKKKILAPFDGSIVTKDVEVGEWVGKGKVIGKIVNAKVVDAMFNIPERFISNLNKNKLVKLSINGKIYEGKIYGVILKGDKLTRTFPVKVRVNLEDERIYDGMQASLKLEGTKSKESLLVPRDAVIKRFDQNVIFTNSDGVAKMTPVEIIGYEGDKVAIKAPMIRDGMRVIVKGNERIFPNQPIKAIK